MNPALNTSILDFAVRMVVPMRREFGSHLDVQQFMHDQGYAQAMVEKAKTSQVERLRQYAEAVERALRSQRPAAAPASARAAIAPPAAFVASRQEAVRALLDAVGPMGEALAIRLERAADPEALGPLLVLAQQTIANVRGAPAAHGFVERVTASAR